MRSSSYICDCQNVDCNTIPEMEKKYIYRSGCLVLCFKQGCCGSVTWILDKKKYIQVLKNVGIVQNFKKKIK